MSAALIAECGWQWWLPEATPIISKCQMGPIKGVKGPFNSTRGGMTTPQDCTISTRKKGGHQPRTNNVSNDMQYRSSIPCWRRHFCRQLSVLETNSKSSFHMHSQVVAVGSVGMVRQVLLPDTCLHWCLDMAPSAHNGSRNN